MFVRGSQKKLSIHALATNQRPFSWSPLKLGNLFNAPNSAGLVGVVLRVTNTVPVNFRREYAATAVALGSPQSPIRTVAAFSPRSFTPAESYAILSSWESELKNFWSDLLLSTVFEFRSYLQRRGFGI